MTTIVANSAAPSFMDDFLFIDDSQYLDPPAELSSFDATTTAAGSSSLFFDPESLNNAYTNSLVMHSSPEIIESPTFYDLESLSMDLSGSSGTESIPQTPLGVAGFDFAGAATGAPAAFDDPSLQLFDDSSLSMPGMDMGHMFPVSGPNVYDHMAPVSDKFMPMDDRFSLTLETAVQPPLTTSLESIHTSPTSSTSTSSNSLMFTSELSPPSSSPAEEKSSDAGESGSSAAMRKQSESRISLPSLYIRMGLGHDHDTARTREQRILGILREEGFMLGERTWIRDTTENERNRIIDEIYNQTHAEYGYGKDLIEVIVRRGSYYLMQGRLRRIRRGKKAMLLRQQKQQNALNNMEKLQAAAAASANAVVPQP